jgi:hypothetical protein
MNDRIKELYEQAYLVREYPDSDPMRGGNPPTLYWGGEASAKKFAELIVREIVSKIEVESSDFYHNESNGWGAITVKYFVSGDPHRMCGEEVQAEFYNGVRGTGRYHLNEEFAEYLMKQYLGVE